MYIARINGQAALQDADVFTALTARALPTEMPALTTALGARTTDDTAHLRVPIDTLRGLGTPDDPMWSASSDAMIAYAASRGWTGDDAVRVHLETT